MVQESANLFLYLFSVSSGTTLWHLTEDVEINRERRAMQVKACVTLVLPLRRSD